MFQLKPSHQLHLAIPKYTWLFCSQALRMLRLMGMNQFAESVVDLARYFGCRCLQPAVPFECYSTRPKHHHQTACSPGKAPPGCWPRYHTAAAEPHTKVLLPVWQTSCKITACSFAQMALHCIMHASSCNVSAAASSPDRCRKCPYAHLSMH